MFCCVLHDNSHHSGRWPGPAGVSGLPAGREWVPSLHRSGSLERWRWRCAARWRGKGGLLLHEWFGIMCCRETRELTSELDKPICLIINSSHFSSSLYLCTSFGCKVIKSDLYIWTPFLCHQIKTLISVKWWHFPT